MDMYKITKKYKIKVSNFNMGNHLMKAKKRRICMSIVIKVCMGTHCSMMGSLNLYDDLEELQKSYPEDIKLEMVRCLQVCSDKKAPVIAINDVVRSSVKSEEIVSELLELIAK